VIEDKDQQVKELWNFAKTLNEKNMALSYKADLWDQREKREKQVKNDSMNMSFANASVLPEFRISNISSNWKNKLDQEAFHKMSDEENALAYKAELQEQREKHVNSDIMNMSSANVSIVPDSCISNCSNWKDRIDQELPTWRISKTITLRRTRSCTEKPKVLKEPEKCPRLTVKSTFDARRTSFMHHEHRSSNVEYVDNNVNEVFSMNADGSTME